jgi:hypothetical protein
MSTQVKEEDMGAIKLATSNSTDEEYGGTFPLDASDIPYGNTTVGAFLSKVQGNLENGDAYNTFVSTKWAGVAFKRAGIVEIDISLRFKATSAMTGSYEIFKIPSSVSTGAAFAINVLTREGKGVGLLVDTTGSISLQNPPALTSTDILACSFIYIE